MQDSRPGMVVDQRGIVSTLRRFLQKWRDQHVHNWLESGQIAELHLRILSKTVGGCNGENYVFWLWGCLKPSQGSWWLGSSLKDRGGWTEMEERGFPGQAEKTYILSDSHHSDVAGGGR